MNKRLRPRSVPRQTGADGRAEPEERDEKGMKRYLAILLSAVMVLTLAACGGTGSSSSSQTSGSASTGSSASQSDSSSTSSESQSESGSQSAEEDDGIEMTGGDATQHTVEAIKSKGTLVVTTEAGYAPFEFMDENDNIVGIDASLAQALAEDMGVTLDIQNIAFDSVVPEVQAGNADMAIAGLTRSPNWLKSVDMSRIYFVATQCLLVRADEVEKYTDAASFDGLVMATQRGTMQEGLMAEQFANAEQLLLPDYPQCVANLVNGECAAVLLDLSVAEQYLSTTEGLAVSTVPVEIDPDAGGKAVAVMRGNSDLLEWVNERIDAYEADGRLDQWYEEAKQKAEGMGIE